MQSADQPSQNQQEVTPHGRGLPAVGRYLKPLRGLSAHDPACFAGKLVGLLDLRANRWRRLEWSEDVHENCRVDMLDFLHGLAVGNLLLFDLGYFSFSFFDTLTQWKLWWVSRYRKTRLTRSRMCSIGSVRCSMP